MAVTREEELLNSLANGVPSDITPITREEQYLSYIGGGSYSYPLEPITRKEALLKSIAEKGVSGGSGVTIRNQNKTITENGTYTADSGYTGLGTVTVDVQASGGESGLKEYHGTITLAENTRSVVIEHPLGTVPKLVMFAELGTANSTLISSSRNKLSFFVYSEWCKDVSIRNKNFGFHALGTSNTYEVRWQEYGTDYSYNSNVILNKSQILVGAGGLNDMFTMDAGDTYYYMVIG